MLAVFNWTEEPRGHAFTLADLMLPSGGSYAVSDVLHPDRSANFQAGRLDLKSQRAHSVRLLKIIDTSVPAAAPGVTASVPVKAEVGTELEFSAGTAVDGVPAISYHWDFGDGTEADGTAVIHAYTYADTFNVRPSVKGVDGITASSSHRLLVTGTLPGKFVLLLNRRYIQPSDDK